MSRPRGKFGDLRGFAAIAFDLGCLTVFSVVAMTIATLLFRRTL